jgi:hypothetical protein
MAGRRWGVEYHEMDGPEGRQKALMVKDRESKRCRIHKIHRSAPDHVIPSPEEEPDLKSLAAIDHLLTPNRAFSSLTLTSTM